MKLIRNTILFLLISFSIFSQKYSKYEAIYLADSLSGFRVKQYSESLKMYDYVFNNFKVAPKLYVKASIIAIKDSQEVVAFKYLNNAINNGWKDIRTLEKEKIFVNLRGDAEWNILINKLKKNIEDMNKYYDLALQDSITRMYDKDQGIRKYIGVFVNGKPKYNNDSLLPIMQNIDSQNQTFLIDLFQKNHTHSISSEAKDMLFTLIAHCDLSTQETFLPVLDNIKKDSEEQKYTYLMIQDKILVKKGKKQKFGTQTEWNNATGKMMLLPVEDCNYAEKIRADLDIEPLSIYLRSIKIYSGCK